MVVALVVVETAQSLKLLYETNTVFLLVVKVNPC